MNASGGRVLIAGGGPVGMTAALALARRGVASTVFEALTETPTLPRASTFHPPTLEMFDELGIGEAFIAQGYRVPRFQYREHPLLGGEIVAEFDVSTLADRTRYPFRLQCPQHTLVALLTRACAESGLVDVRYGARVAGVDEAGDGVVFEIETDGGRERVRGAFGIGADGASSGVRRALGIAFDGMSYATRQLQLMSDVDFGRYLPNLTPVAYIFHPDEWFVLLYTPPNVWRSLVSAPEGMSDDDATAPDRLAGMIRRLIGDEAAAVEIAYSAVYTAHQRLAVTFRRGRTVLVGDAAHVNSPFGGMGVNSGIHDAVTLAPVVATALAAGFDEAALDRWATTRREVAESFVQRDTKRNTSDADARDPAERAARNERLRATARDPEAARAYLLRASMLAAVQPTTSA